MHLQTFMAAVALVVAGITGQPTHAATQMGAPVMQPTKSTQSETVLPADGEVANMPEAVLKASYLACRSASQSPSNVEAMAKCTMVERELVRKVFRGDARAFEAWLRMAAPATDTERPKDDPRAPVLAPQPVGE